MKIFRNILLGMFVFLCLFSSCSGGMEPGKSTPPEKEKDKLEKDAKNPDEDEEEDETDEDADETEGDKTEDNTKEKTPGKTPPKLVFLNYKVVSETEIVFEFSQPVTLISLDLEPKLTFNTTTNGNELKIILTEKLKPATLIEVDLQVKDEHGNTDREQISFRTKNNSVPQMIINELRTEYSKPKAEFIEFKMLSNGNLGALRVFIAGNYKAPMVYEFAPVEVKKDDYIVLHLRTLEEGCKDEHGENLSESGGVDSSPTARDFWVSGSKKLLHKTDAVYVLDQNENVLDAVMISEKPDSQWGKDYFADAAELLFKKGVWKSSAGTVGNPAEAVDTSVYKTAATLSISRKDEENTHTKADWYVTKTGSATPGQPNKP